VQPIPRSTVEPSQRYELVDIESNDCGQLCSFHSPPPSHHVSGALVLRGATATLDLQSSFFQPVVICPSVGPNDPMTPCVQANDPRATPEPHRSDMQLHGSVVRIGATMSLSFTHDGARLELRCTSTASHLECTKTAATTEDKRNWLGLPAHITFSVRSAPRSAVSTL